MREEELSSLLEDARYALEEKVQCKAERDALHMESRLIAKCLEG